MLLSLRRVPFWTLDQFASFVGVDLHKHTVTLVAVDPRQNVIHHLTTSTKCVDRIEAFLRSLPRPVWMAVEADGFIEWFLDRYGPVVDLISIANATELANRRGKRRKNDFNDAKDIGERLARGECPLGWIADPETARLRKLGRHWHQLSRTLSRAKHCMRSILNAANLPGPSKLDGDLTQRWLLGFGHLLKEESRKAFENFLDVHSAAGTPPGGPAAEDHLRQPGREVQGPHHPRQDRARHRRDLGLRHRRRDR